MSDGPSMEERKQHVNELAQRAGDYLMEMAREKACGDEVVGQAAVIMAGCVLDSIVQANPEHDDKIIGAARSDFATLTTHAEYRARRRN